MSVYQYLSPAEVSDVSFMADFSKADIEKYEFENFKSDHSYNEYYDNGNLFDFFDVTPAFDNEDKLFAMKIQNNEYNSHFNNMDWELRDLKRFLNDHDVEFKFSFVVRYINHSNDDEQVDYKYVVNNESVRRSKPKVIYTDFEEV